MEYRDGITYTDIDKIQRKRDMKVTAYITFITASIIGFGFLTYLFLHPPVKLEQNVCVPFGKSKLCLPVCDGSEKDGACLEKVK